MYIAAKVCTLLNMKSAVTRHIKYMLTVDTKELHADALINTLLPLFIEE